MTDEQIKNWLARHGEKIEPDFVFEEEKAEAAQRSVVHDGSWPDPKRPGNAGIFSGISFSKNEFNRVVGDPDNWEAILSDDDLYNQWILPNAILLFAKTWFDRIKWKPSIHKSVPFPLFSDNERSTAVMAKQELEHTPHGKARIAKIMAKASSALEVYLSGRWLEKTKYLKKPGAYIIESIRNDVIREIGTDMGYKLIPTLACPYCLAPGKSDSYKVPLIRHSFKQYSCPKCVDDSNNLELEIQNAGRKHRGTLAAEKFEKTRQFKYFIGVTCVCPNDKCRGKFVPLTCVNTKIFNPERYRINGALKGLCISRDIQSFKRPPKILEDFPLVCPHCDTEFTPRSALTSKSGFKKKSGHLTGLPTIYIWVKKEANTLDEPMYDNHLTRKDGLVAKSEDLNSHINAKQRVSLLIGEIIIRAARVNNKSFDGLMTLYFYKAAIIWMDKYWEDASRYFFGWFEYERDLSAKEMARNPGKTKKKMTNICRGSEVTIHLSFFQEWLKVIEENIEKIREVNPDIKKLKDLKWFCRPPKFSGGPESNFISDVDDKLKIANKTSIKPVSSWDGMPRLAKVLAIYKMKDGVVNRTKNYISDVRGIGWHSIDLVPNTSLKVGEKVKVKALMMSGHPTHTPIQRIIRLRSITLKNIIDRILREEAAGDTDVLFWKSWKNRVKAAKEKVGHIVRSYND